MSIVQSKCGVSHGFTPPWVESKSVEVQGSLRAWIVMDCLPPLKGQRNSRFWKLEGRNSGRSCWASASCLSSHEVRVDSSRRISQWIHSACESRCKDNASHARHAHLRVRIPHPGTLRQIKVKWAHGNLLWATQACSKKRSINIEVVNGSVCSGNDLRIFTFWSVNSQRKNQETSDIQWSLPCGDSGCWPLGRFAKRLEQIRVRIVGFGPLLVSALEMRPTCSRPWAHGRLCHVPRRVLWVVFLDTDGYSIVGKHWKTNGHLDLRWFEWVPE